MSGCSFCCILWVGDFCAEAACFKCRWTGDEMIWPFQCWISPLLSPHRAKLLQLPALLADLNVFAFSHLNFYISTLVFSPSLKQKMSTGGNSWTSAGRVETRSAVAGPLSDCRADQSKWVTPACPANHNAESDFLQSSHNYGYMCDIHQLCQLAGNERKSALYYRTVCSSHQLDLEWFWQSNTPPPH